PASGPSRRVVDRATLVEVKRSVLHNRERSWPAGRRRALGNRVAHPLVRLRIPGREVLEGERLADTLPQLVGDDFELEAQPVGGDTIARQVLKAAVAVFPLPAHDLEYRSHPRPQYLSRGTANLRPQRLELRENSIAELVAGLRERERDVGVQAFETAGARACAADAEVQL